MSISLVLYFQLFTEYGRLAMEESSNIKPFQVRIQQDGVHVYIINIFCSRCVAWCEIGATLTIMSLARKEEKNISVKF